MSTTRTFQPGDIVQIKAGVKVGPWPVGGLIASVAEIFDAARNTGLWLERENQYDFPILVRADDVVFIRRGGGRDA